MSRLNLHSLYFLYLRTSSVVACITLLTWTALPAFAGLESLEGQFANEVEEEAARANQATYEALLVENGGPCRANQRTAQGKCSDGVFEVFGSSRELVHTGNEVSGNGPTEFSLGVDLAGLGTALRWSAGEEFSGQGSLNSEFISAQLSGLASRINALRFGAKGFSIAGHSNEQERYTASQPNKNAYGMGASADQPAAGFSRWGGFLNGSYGYGDKKASGNENAFDFDGYEIDLGLDYRWDNHWVTGVVAGYSQREIDFKQVGIIVVDGGIEAEGLSLMPFALYQSEALYGSLSLGYQQMSFDSDRAIRYKSLNPDVSGTDTRTVSSTDSQGWTMSGSLGYSFTFGGFSVEPYLSAEYRDTRVDAFNERDINNEGFDLRVEDQDIESFEGVLGLRAQYTLTPRFGVFLPYFDLQWRHQFMDDSRDIEAAYRSASKTVDSRVIRFEIATDVPDSHYYVASIGISAVLRGAQQNSLDGPARGGIQVFLAYRTVQQLEDYTYDVIAAGLRYEF